MRPRFTTTPAPSCAASRRTSDTGRGVVVATTRGARPSRIPIIRLSHAASPPGHFAISSAQPWLNCGPRRLSGSAAPNSIALAPLGQTSRRSAGAKAGRHHQGATDSSPEGPSTITLRASPKVAPTSAIRALPSPSAMARTHSAPARVLPKPRPAINSHIRQSPSGAICAARPVHSQ